MLAFLRLHSHQSLIWDFLSLQDVTRYKIEWKVIIKKYVIRIIRLHSRISNDYMMIENVIIGKDTLPQ